MDRLTFAFTCRHGSTTICLPAFSYIYFFVRIPDPPLWNLSLTLIPSPSVTALCVGRRLSRTTRAVTSRSSAPPPSSHRPAPAPQMPARRTLRRPPPAVRTARPWTKHTQPTSATGTSSQSLCQVEPPIREPQLEIHGVRFSFCH